MPRERSGAWGLVGNQRDFDIYTEGHENPVEGFEQRKTTSSLHIKELAWVAVGQWLEGQKERGWKGRKRAARRP